MVPEIDVVPVGVDQLQAEGAPPARRSPRRRPSSLTRGDSNITSKATLTRTTVPEESTIMTPSVRDSMMVAWRRSTSSIASSRRLLSPVSRTVTTTPPTGSCRWLAAITSRSIVRPSARTVCISSETESRRPATRSSKRERT